MPVNSRISAESEVIMGDARLNCLSMSRAIVLPMAAMLAWIAAAPCGAARIYNLVNYSADQDGHSLSGTITTTDDAPLDSLLETAEILDWQWRVAGANAFSASRDDFLTDGTAATGIRISETAIELSLATPESPEIAELQLARSISVAPRGAFGHVLHWHTQYDGTQDLLNIYSARSLHGDAIQGYWSGEPASIGPNTWIIATAVPEPSTLALAAFSILTARSKSRRPAKAINHLRCPHPRRAG
jgi:PEP-CTERM motif